MHNFLSAQPQLHVHLPAVQQALLDDTRFWLERGVDGFRVDAINFAMHDPELRDNPPAPEISGVRTRPFDFQQHIYNQSHPDIPGFLERLRELTDEYGARFTVAEVGGAAPECEMHAFTADDRRLNSAYGFNFLYADRLTPALVRDAVKQWPDRPGMGWPSWAFENHDAPRALSRWATPAHRTTFAALKMLLLVCLRGNIFLYQGEELGLTQVDIPFDRLQDPEAIANWPLTLSRDGARTPMPWSADAPHLGFSVVEPWLPTGPDHAALAVDRQEADPGSVLALTRRLLALRNGSAALLTGDIRIVEASDTLLAFERIGPGQCLLCVFNIGETPHDWAPDRPDDWQIVERTGDVTDWRFGPFAALVAERPV
jgi:alpha-glucosidase